jgi:surface protein
MKKNYSQTFTKENSASSYASFFKSSILKCSKTMLAFLFTLFFAGNSFAQAGDFVTRWNLANTGASTTGLTFGTVTGGGSVSYSWTEVGGSGSGSGTFSGTSLTITGLPSGKTIELRISPSNFQRININNTGDKNRLTDVKQWGTTAWTSMANAFFGCENLNITATDIPNLAGVTSMNSMFQTCKNLSTVPNINSWNTSKVEWMSSVFNNCSEFNENIGSWNTAGVMGMSQMFRSASSFNQNIGNWNTSKVSSMQQMFNLAGAFNQDISGWNTGSVSNMISMFEWASAFNQNLGNWSLNSSVTLNKMLDKSGMSCANYEATLIGWNSQSVTGKILGASGLNYGGNATAARANLVKSTITGGKGWTISGDNSSNVCDAFITTFDLSKAGINATELSIPITAGGSISYTWAEIGGTAKSTSTLTSSGSTLKITGLPSGKKVRVTINPTNLQRIIFNNGGTSDKMRMTTIEQWGTIAWTSMQNAFFGCENLNITATGIPNLAGVTSMECMFQTCKNLSTVPNINSWNTSKVEKMGSLFNNCSKFNQDISGWNTSKVNSMAQMFRNASAFNQNIGGWNLSGLWSPGLTNMLSNTGMDCNNYSATLIGWSNNNSTPNGLTLNADYVKYGSYASSARTNLDVTKNWTISDAGQGTCSAPSLVQMIDFGGFIKHDVTNLDKPLNVYPNPATDFINLEFKGIAPSTFNVLVMDMSGKVIIKLDGVHAESNQYTLPLNGIVSGMYVVKLSDELGNTTINRFNIK